MKVYKEIKRIVGLINPIVISLFVGCSSPTEPISPIVFELDARLAEDNNGYYHLDIDEKENPYSVDEFLNLISKWKIKS